MSQTEIARLEALVDKWENTMRFLGRYARKTDPIAHARYQQASFNLSKAQQCLRNARKGSHV